MKTPDEIKEGLESCVDYYANGCAEQFCDDCPYSENECFQLEKDALAYIRQLEKRLADVNASPFNGGMSQAEYFNGEAGADG